MTSSDEGNQGSLPACPWEQVSVDELLRQFRTARRSPDGRVLAPDKPDWADQLLDRIDDGRAQAASSVTLSDLAVRQ